MTEPNMTNSKKAYDFFPLLEGIACAALGVGAYDVSKSILLFIGVVSFSLIFITMVHDIAVGILFKEK